MSGRSTYRVVALQTHPVFGEVGRNLEAVEALLRGVRADLVVLPELFATGYAFRDVAEVEAVAERGWMISWRHEPTSIQSG